MEYVNKKHSRGKESSKIQTPITETKGTTASLYVDPFDSGHAFDLQRTLGNRAISQMMRQNAAPGGLPSIQRTLTRWDDLQTNGAGIIWAPHRAQPDDHDQLQPQETILGLGASIEGLSHTAPDHWRTSIQSKGAHASAPASLGVEGRIGPDRPEGTEPSAKASLKYKRKLKQAAGGKPYQLNTLLPVSLGGDGKQAEHLVALPGKEAAQVLDIHEKLMRLVNIGKAWIQFDSTVEYEQDSSSSNLTYAKQITINYWEYRPNGKKMNRRGITLQPIPPSDYKASKKKRKVITSRVNNKYGELDDRDDSAATRFQTRVVFSSTNAVGDGVFMEANPLGPDHKMGEEPKSKNNGGNYVWHRRTAELQKAAQNKEKYIAGHLLNHHVGGPGNDSRNLTPIPNEVNANMQTEVERPIKGLVNDAKGWIYYRVNVTHSKDVSGLEYPSQLDFLWYQIDKKGIEVANTRETRKYNISAPSSYAAGTDHSAWDTAGEIRGLSNIQNTTARTKTNLFELILDDNDTLRNQRKIIMPFIRFLNQIGSNGVISTHLHQTVEQILSRYLPKPNSPEMQAWQQIEEIRKNIEDQTDELTSDVAVQLLNATDTIQSEMKIRRDSALQEVTHYQYGTKNPVHARELVHAFNTSKVEEDREFDVLLNLSKTLIQRALELRQYKEGLFNVTEQLSGTPSDRTVSAAEAEKRHKKALKKHDESNFEEAMNMAIELLGPEEMNDPPMSPGQYQNFTEEVTGSAGKSFADNQRKVTEAIVGKRDKPKKMREIYKKKLIAKKTRVYGHQRLKFLWIKYSEHWPETKKKRYAKFETHLQNKGTDDLEELYKENTRLFLKYLHWVETELTKTNILKKKRYRKKFNLINIQDDDAMKS
ncbi:DNA/RNA non-specific endonuclease [Paenibacillus turpanensis]|uniref:DNA/RNA non-specific endonuclease n=1 Tax=Paenibacillus turpanensis TaxID=2689078 RepID=UPI00140CA5AC|nr:DNA/RNA non-specific endonuclease [Paenibacillus turpanensis]